MKHSLTDIDEFKRRATCAVCGPTRIKTRNSKAKTLPARFKCWAMYKKYEHSHKFPYRRHKKDHCELCGFVAVYKGQLDVDHIDGNHKNNDINNLQTLCANCHRLKTHLNKDSHRKLDNPDNI